jgi:hypothetical protein
VQLTGESFNRHDAQCGLQSLRNEPEQASVSPLSPSAVAQRAIRQSGAPHMATRFDAALVRATTNPAHANTSAMITEAVKVSIKPISACTARKMSRRTFHER